MSLINTAASLAGKQLWSKTMQLPCVDPAARARRWGHSYSSFTLLPSDKADVSNHVPASCISTAVHAYLTAANSSRAPIKRRDLLQSLPPHRPAAAGIANEERGDEMQAWLCAGGQSQANWLRAKQALLDLLTQRVRDQSAYTRARSLHTWALLADKCAIPLGHWMLVTQLAIGAASHLCCASDPCSISSALEIGLCATAHVRVLSSKSDWF